MESTPCRLGSAKIAPIYRFSVKRGLKLIMDVESFDYAYFPRGSRGFKVALSDGRDKAVINQEGFYVAPGSLQDEIR